MLGISAVSAARKAVDAEAIGTQAEIDGLDCRRGAFVNLYRYPGGEPVGSAGFLGSSMTLGECILFSAQSACRPDGRRISLADADGCIVEVSMLSEPEEAACGKKELPDAIGSKGVMIQFGRRSAALPPYYSEISGCNPEETLERLSAAAGLPKEAWKLKDAYVFLYSGENYREKTPRGEIVKWTP